jgi:ribosomal protein S18 acetylase RimI-like enzyme
MMRWQANGRCLWLVVESTSAPTPIASGQLIYYPHTAEIANIIVHPHWQRQGIGQTLVSRLLTFASQRHTPFVEARVEAANSPALALYKKLGFTENGRVTLNQTPIIILHKTFIPNDSGFYHSS